VETILRQYIWYIRWSARLSISTINLSTFGVFLRENREFLLFRDFQTNMSIWAIITMWHSSCVYLSISLSACLLSRIHENCISLFSGELLHHWRYFFYFFVAADINECVPNDDRNCCNQGCTNTDGSYYCTCNDGYLLGADNCTCEGNKETVSVLHLFLTQYKVDLLFSTLKYYRIGKYVRGE